MAAENGHSEPIDDGLYRLEEPVEIRPPLPGQVVVRPDADDVIDSLAADFVMHAENCVREFGDFHVALSGGPTFDMLYRRLMYDPNYRRMPWRRAHVWIVDEYCVPADDERSRCTMVADLIADHADIPPEQFHRITAQSATATADYEALLREALAWREKGQDRLDYALLTVEPDGGTAGIASAVASAMGSAADLRNPERLVCRCPSGEGSGPDRISLTLPFLNASRFIAVLITGAPLADTVQRISGNNDAPATTMPIRDIAPLNGELKWYLDGPACGAAPASD